MSPNDKRVAEFLRDIHWKTLPQEVQDRVVCCVIDLFGAVIAGTATPVAEVGRNIAKRHFTGVDASVLMTQERASLPGAALANGLAANALDIDDGHRLIKGHPGAAVFPAVLAAAEQRDAGLQEFLAALTAAYETAIRAGLAMQKHYDYYHSTGAWGAVGAAAGVAKILGLTEEETVRALATADFHAPMVPVMRSVAFPSNCKDGVGWGAMTGVLAALLAREGFTGGPSIFDCPAAEDLTADLGSRYEIMDLYFKARTCCRWAHPAVRAVLDLRRKHEFIPGDIQRVRILTFHASASLYRGKPRDTEEAQYNGVYPVAAALVAGEVGPRQILGPFLSNPDVLALMDRIEVRADERCEQAFPARRLCEVEVTTTDGGLLRSGIYQAEGEPEDPVTLTRIVDKFRWLTRDVLPRERADALIGLLTSPADDPPVRRILDLVR
jgi:2-methylcitrate dehydratase PrpD